MIGSEPGLFDLPESTAAAPRPARGRKRETWRRTTTATVSITDRETLCRAAVLAEENQVVVHLGEAEPLAGDEGGADLDPVDLPLHALAELLWPTEGLDELLDAGALRVLAADSEVISEDEPDRATVVATVTVKLRDVDQVRRLATERCPDQAGAIDSDFVTAWQCAADPFAALGAIPGIAWQPVGVAIEHLPARTR